MANTTSRPIRLASPSGPTGWPQPSFIAGADGLGARDPLLQSLDGVQDVGDQQGGSTTYPG